jgi:hypothetical protein
MPLGLLGLIVGRPFRSFRLFADRLFQRGDFAEQLNQQSLELWTVQIGETEWRRHIRKESSRGKRKMQGGPLFAPITLEVLNNVGLAEGMRFELTVEVDPLQRFSKPPPSATRPPLHRGQISGTVRRSEQPGHGACTTLVGKCRPSVK